MTKYESDPDEPLFGLTKEMWMNIPKEERERGHKLARDIEEQLDKMEKKGTIPKGLVPREPAIRKVKPWWRNKS